MMWNPIDTVPLHTDVMVWVRDHKGKCGFAVLYVMFNGTKWIGLHPSIKPTHWQHVPKEPGTHA